MHIIKSIRLSNGTPVYRKSSLTTLHLIKTTNWIPPRKMYILIP